jgi:hypothetical protein
MKKIFTFSLFIFSFAAVCAQDQPAGKIHGYVFGDYFYKFGGANIKAASSTQYSDSALNKSGAFQIRRIYLYYEHNLSEKFFAQFLLESNDKSVEYTADKAGKPTKDGRHTVFVKLAYLEWKDIIPQGNLAFGMVPTPTWALSEKMWNYRPIEKTVMDMRGLGGASDIGVTLRGKLGNDGMFGYAFMVGNGNGQKPENNKSKKYYGSLSAKPVKGITTEVYYDQESKILNSQNHETMSRTSLKGLAAYQHEKFTIGVEMLKQTQKKVSDTTDIKPLGLSVFAWAPVSGSDKLNAFARFDTYDPDTQNSAAYKENFITAGIDYMPIKNVHIMPNLWMNSFSKKGSKRDTDKVVRITFFYVYK